MSLQATWVGREQVERIADVRLRCYGDSPALRDAFIERTRRERHADGDVLILSDATGDIATAASLSLTINVRGTDLPCQGVAWVGTVRSHRRRKIDGRGLATHVMHALAEKAAERGQAVGLLAPFRVSFYEAFGYGVLERQHVWTLPLNVLPDDDTDGFAEARTQDFDAMLACRDRQYRQTHGDVATSAGGLNYWLWDMGRVGFRMVERRGDTVHSSFTLGTEVEDGRKTAVVHNLSYDSPAALRRVLAMLRTLKDQYAQARVTLPADLPLNWWLAERQVPHRKVDHPAGTVRVITRMQGRLIDPVKVITALRPEPDAAAGVLQVAVRKRDGVMDVRRLEVADGRATVTASDGDPDIVVDEAVWAAVVFGDLGPRTAATLGLLELRRPAVLDTLAALVAGPAPYCHEYF